MHPELGRFLTRDPLGYVDGMNMGNYVGGNTLKYIDAFGLLMLFGGVEGDIVIWDEEGSAGLQGSILTVFDFNDTNGGRISASGGKAIGCNVGVGVVVGLAFRDIEGESLNFDLNLGVIGFTFIFDDKGFNGLGVSAGPGAGVSMSYQYGVELFKYKEVIDWLFDDLFSFSKTAVKRVAIVGPPIFAESLQQPESLKIKSIIPKRKMTSNLGPNPMPKQFRDKCLVNENQLSNIPSSLFETNLEGINPPSVSDVFGFGDDFGPSGFENMVPRITPTQKRIIELETKLKNYGTHYKSGSVRDKKNWKAELNTLKSK